MYKNKDLISLPRFRQSFHNSDELYAHIAERFHLTSNETDSSLRMSIMALAYMCQYITYEELSVFLGSYFSSSTIRRMVGRMVDSGILKREKFELQDSYSRYAFCLGKKAIEYAGSLFPLECRQNLKVRRSMGIVPEHDYSAGMNMLHLLASPLSFTWKKEFMFGGVKKVKRSLCVDYVVPIANEQNPVCLYIEQDMGTETIGRLIEKIEIYGDHGIPSQASSILVFSFRKAQPAVARSSYLHGCFSSTLLDSMKATGEKSLYAYYERYTAGDISVTYPYNYTVCLKKFLVATGVCEPAAGSQNTLNTMAAPASLSAEHITEQTVLTRIKSHDITIKDLVRYCKDEDAMCNPYSSINANRQQASSAFRKELSMLGVLTSYVKHGHVNRDSIRLILGGFPVYAVPTALFGNSLPFFVPERFDTVTKWMASLSDYYDPDKEWANTSSSHQISDTFAASDMAKIPGAVPEMQETQATQQAPAMPAAFLRIVPQFRLLPNDPAIILRDCFTAGNGLICVASSHNISAIVQACYFGSCYQMSTSFPYSFLHFIFLVDTPGEAVQLASILNCYTDDSYVNPEKAAFNVYFLLAQDMGKARSLKAVIKYDDMTGTDYDFFSVLPGSEKPDLKANGIGDIGDFVKSLFANDSCLP